MKAKESLKRRSKQHGKDLPRYKAIVAYEKDFKGAYAKILGESLAEVVNELRKI